MDERPTDEPGDPDEPEEEPQEDTPPWERLVPSDWLRPPRFRSDGWLEEVRRIIDEGRDARKKPKTTLTPGQIESLEAIIARYIKTRVDWDGFLNKGDADVLDDVRKKAQKLLTALEKLQREPETQRRRPGWYVELKLSEAVGGVPSWDCISEAYEQGRRELAELEKRLSTLTAIEVKSPQLENTRGTSGWPSPTEAGARPELQAGIDCWWTEVTQLSKAKQPDEAPAFHEFLNEIFGRINLTAPPRASETAIANARRDARKRSEAKERNDDAQAKKLVRWRQAIKQFKERLKR